MIERPLLEKDGDSEEGGSLTRAWSRSIAFEEDHDDDPEIESLVSRGPSPRHSIIGDADKPKSYVSLSTLASRIIFTRGYTVIYLLMTLLCMALLVWGIISRMCFVNACLHTNTDTEDLVFQILDWVATGFLVLELIIRILATRRRFCKSCFNVLDFIIMALLIAAGVSDYIVSFNSHGLNTVLLFLRYFIQLSRILLVCRRHRERQKMLKVAESTPVVMAGDGLVSGVPALGLGAGVDPNRLSTAAQQGHAGYHVVAGYAGDDDISADDAMAAAAYTNGHKRSAKEVVTRPSTKSVAHSDRVPHSLPDPIPTDSRTKADKRWALSSSRTRPVQPSVAVAAPTATTGHVTDGQDIAKAVHIRRKARTSGTHARANSSTAQRHAARTANSTTRAPTSTADDGGASTDDDNDESDISTLYEHSTSLSTNQNHSRSMSPRRMAGGGLSASVGHHPHVGGPTSAAESDDEDRVEVAVASEDET